MLLECCQKCNSNENNRKIILMKILMKWKWNCWLFQGDSSAVMSMSDGRDTDSMMDSSASEMLVNMNYSSLEEFYPAVAIATLMRVVKDQTLSQHHNSVVTAVMFIFKSLGVRSVPYIKQVPFISHLPAIFQRSIRV